MRYLEISPPADLSDRVRCLWIVEQPEAQHGDAHERILPDGCLELVLHWGAPYQADTHGKGFSTQQHALLGGQLDRALLLRPTGAVGMLGARLQPWASDCLQDIKPIEIHQQLIPLAELWGAAMKDLPERLSELRGDAARQHLIVDLLRSKLRPLNTAGRELAAVITKLERGAGAPRIAQLARESGHSTRQLQRRFADRVGLSPKHFARITRLQALTTRFERSRNASLAQLAAQLDFADQSHLAREVKEIVGLSLGEWRDELHPLASCFLGASA